ncbi:hypothetical protein PG984_010220 [Apiospora sp. TS-2023a]
MTNIGPLTTTLTPATGCLQTVWGQIYTEHNDGQNSTTHKYHSLGRSATSECYPSGFEIRSDAFYSPGLCPSGWTSACGTPEVIGTITETRATCCPKGYSCLTNVPSTETWSTLSCSSAAISPIAIIVPDVDNQQEKTTTLDGALVNAAAINIRWQKTDFVPTATTTTLDHATPTTETTNSGKPPASPNDVGTPLSTAAKAGIGTGATFGVLLVIGAVAFLFFQRKKRNNSLEKPNGLWEQDATGGGDLPEVYWGQEVHGQSEQEMPTRDNMPEMNGRSGPTELHGTAKVELDAGNQGPAKYYGSGHEHLGRD